MNARTRLTLASLALVGIARPSAAQTPAQAATPPVRNTKTDDPFYRLDNMEWPAPGRVRTAVGTPGPDYWQQRVDYTIAATLDTTTKTITGTVRIRYRNNSPDTLKYLWLQLDQNLYKPESWGAAINPQDSRWGVRGFAGGYTLSNVKVDGSSASYDVSDTRMRIDLARPIAPKGSVTTISMGFSFPVPEHGSDRMGRDGTLYEIAQWYPRMAVYDDIRGWNTDPYLGQGEFYLEYGDIDFSVTVPAGYTVAASGLLQNPTQVLTATQRARLAKAATSTTVVPIIMNDEAIARPTPGTKTWHFLAKSVRDVAWAAAPDFRWDAVSTGPIEGNSRGVLCQAYYQYAKAGHGWEWGAKQTQFTIQHYSQLVMPFQYPQATSVAGPVGGMEYPMFQMTHYGPATGADSTSVFGTIDHEHGHEWFPMMVGSNERRYTWMDEGFNTYINAFNLEKYGMGDQWAFYMQKWRDTHAKGIESPLMTAPDHIDRLALGTAGYRKPGAVLLALRNHVVGRKTFDAAFRSYARAWLFKHPTPGDFFRTIENYAGMDLSWYWRDFWYTTKVMDIGIDSVQHKQDNAGKYAIVVLQNVTGVPFPVELRVKYASGKTADFKYPVDVWSTSAWFKPTFTENGDQVVGVRLWPDPTVPDWNSANDTWGKAPDADPVHSVLP